MEMHQVRYFVTLCETLNFTKAAEACNVTQPSLTKAIHKLEDELGGPLFCRERGLTHLTGLGKIMEPHLKAVCASSEAARTEANSFLNQGKATLQLGIQNSISPTRFISFFHGFHEHSPAVALDLHVESQCSLTNKLLSGEIDVAAMHDEELPDRCDKIPLFTEGYVLIARPSDTLTNRHEIGISELENISLLPHGLSFPCLKNQPVREIAQCSGKIDWTQSLVLAGLGAAILPASTPILSDLAAIPINEPSMVLNIVLVTVSGRRHTPALRTLRSFATQHDWSSQGLSYT